MSDTSQGPGWWQASDGKWYPPDQASGGGGGAQFAGAGAGGGGVPSAAGAGAGVAGQWGTLAEWPQRAVGFLIDYGLGVALIIIGFIVAAIFGAISSALGLLFGLVFYVAGIGVFFYFGYMVGNSGQSPGMRLTGLKCLGEATGQPIGGGMGIVRHIAHIVDSIICYIGWLFPLWDEKKQTIADKLMKTVVITGLPKQQFSAELFQP